MSARSGDVHVFDSLVSFHNAGIAMIGAAAAEAIAARGSFSLALTGGGDAQAFYLAMAADGGRGLVEWIRTRVWWGDERCVPPDHADSNYRMAFDTLLKHVPIERDAIHRMRGEDPDVDWAATDYAKSLPERFDLMLLGMGPDGHVCSLFPGRRELDERERLVLPIDGSPKPPSRRLTVTPPVIDAARKLMVMVSSGTKADAVAAALADGPVSDVPARLARRGTWILMRDAASKIA